MIKHVLSKGVAKTLLLFVIGMVSIQFASGQCTNASLYPFTSPAAPTTVGQSVTNSTCNYYGEYSVIGGFDAQYVYSLAIAPSGYVTVYSSSGGAAVAFGASPLAFTPPSSGSYNVHWSADAACGTDFACHTTTVTLTGFSAACTNPALGGTAVSNPSMACSGQNINLTLTGASNGSGLTYQWQSSPNGTTYTNIPSATNASYSTTQSASTYYQCIVTCSAGSTATSAPIQVNMNSFYNCYCTSTATQAFDTEIGKVAVATLNNAAGCGVTGGGTSVVGLYSDFTQTVAAPNLIQGINNTFTLEVVTCGSFSYNNMSKVYIDMNQNGLFTDAGEEVYVSSTFSLGPHVETFTLNVPLSATPGNTRMRVVTVETTISSTINPCGTYFYGETEDYFVNIVAPLNDDAGIVEFVTPTLPTCNFADSVRVALGNFGLDTLTSAVVNWEWNGVPQTPLSWTGMIPPFSSDTITLGLLALVPGNSLLAYTTMPNGVIENPSGSYNDSVSIGNLQSGLTGTKTVGGTAPDYATLADAVADLNLLGICGPVIFNIRDGVYNEQVILPSLANSSAVNTVTFRSENGDPALVTVSFAGTGAANNYVLRFSNSDYYIIEDLTLQNTGTAFGHVLEFTGGADNNLVQGCKLISSTTTTTSNNMAVIYSFVGQDNNNTFKDNSIENGSYGAHWYGTIASPEVGTLFEGNKFLNNYFYGARLQYQTGPVVTKNYIGGNSTYGFRYGLYFSDSYGAPVATDNEIVGTMASGWLYGIYFFNCGGNNANRALVANNMIQVGAATTSTSALYGIYLTGSGYMDVYHNSVLAASGSALSRAFFATSGGEIEVMNNIFANYTAGYAIYAGNSFSISNSDHNVLYSPSGKTGFFGSDQLTLANWQTAAAFDANSLNYNPNFHSSVNLHVCNDSVGNQGTPLSIIVNDIDGHPRSATNPDMGADEFKGLTGSFLGPDAVVCTGDSVQLWAGAPTDTILWSNGATTSSIWVSTPGSYTVSIVSPCGTGTDAIVVSASALNYAGFLAASDIVFCNGDSVLLNSSQVANTYSWTGGSTNDSLYVTAGGTYTLNIADNCGTGSEAITVTMHDVPVASYTHTTTYLTGVFSNTSVSGGNTTYLWNFGDGTTSTLSNPSHIYNSSGLYYATLTVTNDCGSITFGDTVNLFVLGIEEVADFGSLNVYPNPSTGLYTVEMDLLETTNLEIRVTNVMGQVVSTRTIQGANGIHSEQLDLTNEAAGVYYLDILSEKAKMANRVLIKK